MPGMVLRPADRHGPDARLQQCVEVSFEFELSARVESWAAAEAIAADTRAPQFVPLAPGRRRRWFRDIEPRVVIDWEQGQAILSDDADLNDDCLLLATARREPLAQTILLLAERTTDDFKLRSYWIGDPLHTHQILTATQLAELVRRSELNRHTRYVIAPP
jgi:hypothetical protein